MFAVKEIEETTNYGFIRLKCYLLKVKGRYLNLQEGKLETTEKMYKHHVMQVVAFYTHQISDQISDKILDQISYLKFGIFYPVTPLFILIPSRPLSFNCISLFPDILWPTLHLFQIHIEDGQELWGAWCPLFLNKRFSLNYISTTMQICTWFLLFGV